MFVYNGTGNICQSTNDDYSEASADSTCYDVFVNSKEKHILQIHEDYYYLDINPPTVVTTCLPSCIMSGYLLYPKSISLKNANQSQSVFVWYCSDNTFTNYKHFQKIQNRIIWSRVHEGIVLHVQQELIGKVLKVCFLCLMESSLLTARVK